MTLNWIHIRPLTVASAAVLLCLAPASAQSGNPWNPYPAQQQAQPAPTPPPPPAPKPKYYEEAPTPLPSAQSAQPDASGPSRFAPPDLAQRLSAGPQRQSNAPFNNVPFGYQGAPYPPNANPSAYYGQPQGYPQGYMMGGPPNPGGYGGYGPPVIGNNSWGGFPSNNFSPFGFW
jgi:hypothetical protein